MLTTINIKYRRPKNKNIDEIKKILLNTLLKCGNEIAKLTNSYISQQTEKLTHK